MRENVLNNKEKSIVHSKRRPLTLVAAPLSLTFVFTNNMAHPSAIAAAFTSTGLISLAPNILLFLFPNYSAEGSGGRRATTLLSLGQALAVGGLLGDVFLHTLPDCFADSMNGHGHHESEGAYTDHQHHHGGGEVGLRVIIGFAAFLILDLLVRSLEGGHSDEQHSHSNHNGHSSNGATRNKTQKNAWRIVLSSTVLLNLLGDSLHNFTDGLAIGATFAASQIPQQPIDTITTAFALLKSRGGLASISVLLHEIPHELGDFATLVNAGLSRNAAIGLQFLTAVAAFLGTALGLFSSHIIEGLGHDVLLPFTAGGFVYLACATILPEILETDASAGVRVLQVASFGMGVLLMYFVAELEEMEEKASGESHHRGHVHGEL